MNEKTDDSNVRPDLNPKGWVTERSPSTVFITIGPQASGKNTFIAKHPVLSQVVQMSHDDFMVGKWTREKWAIIHEFFNQTLDVVIQEKHDLIVNDMYLLPEYRAPIIVLAKEYGYSVCAIFMNTSREQCHEWNKKRGTRSHYGPIPIDVLDDAYDKFEEFNPADKIVTTLSAEGFDEILIVDLDKVTQVQLSE